jgi:hypothetical protein
VLLHIVTESDAYSILVEARDIATGLNVVLSLGPISILVALIDLAEIVLKGIPLLFTNSLEVVVDYIHLVDIATFI